MMISVIVPVYNAEKYLGKCVNSILNQDYKDIELILVDDGSKDSSPAMCDEFAKQDKRIKVVHKENGGPAKARNTGLDIAKGEYIAFVDSDDWLEPDMYSHLIELIKINNADMAFCEIALNHANGEIIKKHRVDGELVMTRLEAMAHRFDGSDIISDSLVNKVYKKSVFENVRLPEDRCIGEDSSTVYRLVDNSNIIVASERIGYNVRKEGESLTRGTYSPRYLGGIITFKEMAAFLSSKEEYKKYVSVANSYIAGAIFFNAGEMYGVDFEGKNETEKYIKKCSKELLLSDVGLSSRNKLLLNLISVSPKLFGVIYKKVKKV